jgi:hypothetical protein
MASRSDAGTDLVDRCDVKSRTAPLEAAANRVGRGEVSLDQLAADRREVARLSRRAHERDHFVPPLTQPSDEPSADEAGGAGHESSHVAPF